MKCKDCDYFCRFPNKQSEGICAEHVQQIILADKNEIVCKNYVRHEENNCNNLWYKPM